MAVTEALQSTTQNDDEDYYEPPPGPPPSRFVPSPLHPVNLPLVLPQHRYNLAVQGWTTVTLSGADPAAAEMSKCINELFAASKHFFSLPESYKSKFQTGDGSEEGWSSIPGEKEFITLRRLDKVPDGLRDAAVNAWSRIFGGLLDQTLARVEESLELEPSSLTRFAEPCANLDHSKRATMLRLFRYEGWEDKVVAEPHNDLGLLSLVAGDSPGLEVWNSQNRSFFPIEKLYEPTGTAATLLAGRQLQRLTNGRYVPGCHLVRSYPQPHRGTVSATASATDEVEEPRYRYSIVFVLRAHSPVIINTDNLTTRITGKHREPIKGATAHELFLKIKNAHYNINTGIQDREEQKRRIEEKKKQAIEPSATIDKGSPTGSKDEDSVV
jgi:isopenicillin N synthase-like dioxygenase